jgi:enamine deaminase RidA (YjgF/YER057c/UK114 family)
MIQRSHVGFDELWSMRIPVPYSLLLRSGDLGWSCGQCPLDRDGQVIAPGDVLAQADVVGSLACTVLERGGFHAADLVMAVVYTTAADPAPVLARLRAALGQAAVFAPVTVPEFYYPGMEIELDLFVVVGGPGTPDRIEGPGWKGHAVTAGGLRFMAVGLQPGADAAALRRTLALDGALVEHWGLPDATGLPPHAMIGQNGCLWAVTAHGAQARSVTLDGADITLRAAPGWLSLTGTAPAIPGLVPQTEAIMAAIDTTLGDHGAGFADVVKSTTHYVGNPTPADLHDNMAVRNRRYTSPGPASTGIRVQALAHPAALTAISLLVEHRTEPALRSASRSV